jgi:NAD(P)-dependent dehydrogenase (short-subunit alcohol dehydrogenase family)
MAVIATMLKNKWLTPPAPASESFHGRTILVTGSTSGLGHATALRFAQLGASKVILTARDAPRGAQVKSEMETLVPQCEFTVWPLNMLSRPSVVEFTQRAEKEEKIDIVVLNAGVRKSVYSEGEQGWEEDIQVNLLSTLLLSVLLLPVLKKTRDGTRKKEGREGEKPVMLFVNTGFHSTAVISDKVRDNSSILDAYNDPKTFAAQRQYVHSKLLLMHCVSHLSSLTPSNEVIITSVCPGAVATNLARDIRIPGFVILLAIMRVTLQRTPEQGADALVNAATQEEGGHGR